MARKRRTIVIAGGGTGGHVFPGIAVARELRRRDAARPLEWIGARAGLETRLVPAEGIPLTALNLGGMAGLGLAVRAASAMKAAGGTLACLRRFAARRPAAVLGVGGFASGPAGLAAALLRVPLVLHEQNARPGGTNRSLARFAKAVALSFEGTREWLPARVRAKSVVTGNPVRAEFFSAPATGTVPHAKSATGTVPHEETASRPQAAPPLELLVFGGSRGARSINRALGEALPLLSGWRGRLHVVHQTGEAELQAARAAHTAAGFDSEVVPFLDDMPERMRRADLVLARSGASTVFELAAVGRPSILVPFPQAAGGHQADNARLLAEAGAARIIEDHALTGRSLADALDALLADTAARTAMGAAARSLARPDAAARIADLVESAAGAAEGRAA